MNGIEKFHNDNEERHFFMKKNSKQSLKKCYIIIDQYNKKQFELSVASFDIQTPGSPKKKNNNTPSL